MNQNHSENDSPLTVANGILIASNIAIFLYLNLIGDPSDAAFMYEHGAMISDPGILNGAYWRLISCTFLHFNVQHIFNNMVMLLFLGSYVEKTFGSVRYGLFYLICATISSAVSYGYALAVGNYTVSGGASGGVFAVMGALFVIVLCQREKYRRFRIHRFLFMIALSLYYGFTTAGVDNAAHVGGLLAGIVLGFIFFQFSRFAALTNESDGDIL